MGVYIKGMEMPKNKAVAVVIHPDGTAYTAKMSAGVCTEYLADRTAVPVPPHGRLVDADRLLSEQMKRKYYHLPNGDTAIPIIDVEHAPTIIEAEE